MKIVIKVLLWIWQLPQNLAGLIVSVGAERNDTIGTVLYVKEKFYGSAVSLGDRIIIQRSAVYKINVDHEKGHQVQSKVLGPLYLPIVGLPSLLRNVWDRIFHEKWTTVERYVWYYSGYPEQWADSLGGVKRWS